MADSGMMREAWAAYEPFRDQFTSLAPDKYPPEYIDGCVMIGSWRCWGTAIAAIESRPAWQKLLPGYEPEQVRIVKGLN